MIGLCYHANFILLVDEYCRVVAHSVHQAPCWSPWCWSPCHSRLAGSLGSVACGGPPRFVCVCVRFYILFSLVSPRWWRDEWAGSTLVRLMWGPLSRSPSPPPPATPLPPPPPPPPPPPGCYCGGTTFVIMTADIRHYDGAAFVITTLAFIMMTWYPSKPGDIMGHISVWLQPSLNVRPRHSILHIYIYGRACVCVCVRWVLLCVRVCAWVCLCRFLDRRAVYEYIGMH